MTRADVTDRERAHFDGMADQESLFWADRTPAGARRRELRARWFVRAGHIGAGMRVLELGCGLGHMTRAIAGICEAEIVAMDLSPALIAAASRDKPGRVEYRVGNVEQLEFPAETFDAVVGNAVLHHLRLAVAIPEIVRVLKPGGRLCFTEPNYLNPQVFVVLRSPALRRRVGASPDETAFLRWRLRRDLARYELRDVDIRPFDFLHPAVPSALIDVAERTSALLERVPLAREFAGSLAISATKR
jgi:SAM-dependent methyltransferase